jgi:hypothetical protein
MNISIAEFKKTYSDDDVILPGHGASGLFKDIKKHNQFFNEKR